MFFIITMLRNNSNFEPEFIYIRIPELIFNEPFNGQEIVFVVFENMTSPVWSSFSAVYSAVFSFYTHKEFRNVKLCSTEAIHGIHAMPMLLMTPCQY